VDKNLVGTWTVVSVTYEQEGKKIEPYGPNVKGTIRRDVDTPVLSLRGRCWSLLATARVASGRHKRKD
jgi:hypothetical protein